MTLRKSAEFYESWVTESIRQILIRCDGVVRCIYHSIDRGDMLKIMARTDVATASDGTAYSLSDMPGKPHPRNTSTFPCFSNGAGGKYYAA